jgi:hypothetical protein
MYNSNRPERCGAFAASMHYILITARSAVYHFSAPEYAELMTARMRELAAYAETALARDDEMEAADVAALEEYCHTEPPADVAHECGTPAEGALDMSGYPASMTVMQRDLADPESWIYRCAEGHPSDSAPVLHGIVFGWQSMDYASEHDALTAAAEHARAMHDGGLPNDLAERLALAEAAAVAANDSIIGRRVNRTDDDSDVPAVGTITGITADPEFVMVTWLPVDANLPAIKRREAMDELTAARGPKYAHEG